MNRLYAGAAILAVVLAFLAGTATSNRRAAVNDQFCLLDTTIVQFLDKGLSGTTKEDLIKRGVTKAQYDKAYNQTVDLINALVEQAPCKIIHSTAPNVFEPVAPTGTTG